MPSGDGVPQRQHERDDGDQHHDSTLATRENSRTCRRRALDCSNPSWISGTVDPSSAATLPSRRSGKRARMRASRRPTVSATYSASSRGRSSAHPRHASGSRDRMGR